MNQLAMPPLTAVMLFILAGMHPTGAISVVISGNDLVLDFTEPDKITNLVKWTDSEYLSLTADGLGWDGEANASRDVTIETLKPTAVGWSWLPLTALHVEAEVLPAGEFRIGKDSISWPRTAGTLYARYSPDGVHWSSWQALSLRRPRSQEKPRLWHHGTLRVPGKARQYYVECLKQFAGTDRPIGVDEEAAVHWILNEDPAFFQHNLPFIGYVEFLWEKPIRGDQRLKQLKIYLNYSRSGFARVPEGHKEGGPWMFKSPDGHITDETPEDWVTIGQQAEAAFNQGRYDKAADLYGRLADRKIPTVDNLLWLGHAHQMAGNWKAAVAAYRLTVKRIDFLQTHHEVPANHEEETQTLQRQGDQLRLLIGLIEREEIGDLKQAAATFAESANRCDILKHSVPHLLAEYQDHLRERMAGNEIQRDQFIRDRHSYPYWCLKELAVTQDRMGHVAEALATWDKVHLISLLYGQSGPTERDMQAMGRLFQNLKADKPLPEISSLLVLSPDKKSYSLDFSDASLTARAYKPLLTRTTHFWEFACSAPPGQEIATLEVSCDIEQHKLGHGGHFSCWLEPYEEGRGRINLGGINWPKGKSVGRNVITEQFDVPAGAGLVYIQNVSSKSNFTVHSTNIKPTFRPRAKDGVAPIGGARFQNQALPKGGTLICDGEEIHNESAYNDFPAGYRTFSYEIAGRSDKKQLDATLVPGGRYGLFINLDSPFATTLTNLRHFSELPSARSTIVRLPDGRWLIAYASTEGRGANFQKIMLSTSRDLVTWDTPWPLSHNSVFVNKTPSLVVDKQGNIWLAWFSNRLHLQRKSTAGYRLWLTHSRDGKIWSSPVPVDCGSEGPWGGAQMAHGPDGKYWMFIGGLSASADSPGALRKLSGMTVEGREKNGIRTPHVVWDSENRMHMVYTDFHQAIWYATSRDGQQWTNPIEILSRDKGRSVDNPQLIFDGGRLGVVYEDSRGAWLCRRMLNANGNSLGETSTPVKISHHVLPLNGSRLNLTPDGQVVVLAGSDTVWLLHSELDRIFSSQTRDGSPKGNIAENTAR